MPRHGGIFIVLGGAPSVWAELEAARALLGRRGHGIVACNLAGIEFSGDLDGWATLHPEHLAKWRGERAGNADFRAFVPNSHPNSPGAEVAPQRWHGSSGLYAAQVALERMAASGVILCGVPMDPDAGHFTYEGRWTGGEGYRKGFVTALPVIGARLRSMDGWTRDVFGPPSAPWLAALDGARPVGGFQPSPQERPPMYDVKNVSATMQKVQVRDPRGGFQIVHLKPGESGAYDVDPNQARYQPGGPLTAKLIKEAKLAPSAKPKSAPKPKAAKAAKASAKPAPDKVTVELTREQIAGPGLTEIPV